MLRHLVEKIGLDRELAVARLRSTEPFQIFPLVVDRVARAMAEGPVKKSSQQAALEFAQTSLEANRGASPVTLDMIRETVDGILKLPKAILDTSTVDRDLLIEELEERYSVWIGKTVALDENEDHVAWLTPERGGGGSGSATVSTLSGRGPRSPSRRWTTRPAKSFPGRRSRAEGTMGPPGIGGGARPVGEDGQLHRADLQGCGRRLQSHHRSCRPAQQSAQPDPDPSRRGLSRVRDRKRGERLNSIAVGEIDRDPDIRPNYVTTRNEKGDFRLAVVKNLGISPSDRPMLFVVKKNTSVLKNLIRWIDGILDGRKAFRDVPLLIIDDEADHASVDTKAQAFDENGKLEEATIRRRSTSTSARCC